jgi:Flp pilus assembly secretin CpaC
VEATAKRASRRLIAASLAAVLCATVSLRATAGSPFEPIGESGTIRLSAGKSLLLRTKVAVYRMATAQEGVVELVPLAPREISLSGRSEGQTQVTFWFADPAQPPVTYVVEVTPAASE